MHLDELGSTGCLDLGDTGSALYPCQYRAATKADQARARKDHTNEDQVSGRDGRGEPFQRSSPLPPDRCADAITSSQTFATRSLQVIAVASAHITVERIMMDELDEIAWITHSDNLASNPVWRKASYSASGNCVEVASFAGRILLRNSRARHGPALVFTLAEWKAFLAGAVDGEFDPF